MTIANTGAGQVAAVSEQERSALARLTTAIAALSEAVDFMPIADVVSIKAQVATIQTATKELGMSKEAQELAVEAVRRAEWTLGMAIRRGQAEGTVAVRGSFGAGRSATEADLNRPTDFASDTELHGNPTKGAPGILSLADSTSDVKELDAALESARAEGNQSRANVVRKLRGEVNPTPVTRDQRADVIADLAQQGYTSHQMADRVGVAAARVREIARAYGIAISADKAVGRGGQRIDHTAAVESAVTRLEHLTDSLTFIDFTEVDRSETDEWTASLTNSIRALNRFKKQIEETIHVH